MKVTSKFFLAAMLTVTVGVAGLKSANAGTYDWNFTPGAVAATDNDLPISDCQQAHVSAASQPGPKII